MWQTREKAAEMLGIIGLSFGKMSALCSLKSG
jgi:hypothetical protein